MQPLNITDFDKQIKSLNSKRKQLLSLQVKIKDEELKHEKELVRLKKKHEKKMSNLIKKQNELTQFLTQINQSFSNSSPCGDELANA